MEREEWMLTLLFVFATGVCAGIALASYFYL